MIAIALLLAAAAAAPIPAEAQRYRSCIETAGREPAVAIPEATKWIGAGGGVPARHCLALAYIAAKDYAAATQALDGAARAAEAQHDPHVAELWGQAGNSAFMANKYDAAAGYFTTGITAVGNDSQGRAELLIDRARALVELKRYDEAKSDLAEATRLEPDSPFGWLLRATLARRQGDLAAAETSLMEATKRAPDDPDVQLEAGNVAAAQGKMPLARQAWSAAAAAAPGSPAAAAATEALAANPK
ncbi:tetratricopeptide repeat protein [Glacieibacterium sp.]|uniref:tetratricopeptide repeat protein n=1 Tax=Glacieibacterium sp. TaxID=2860237 RepID=UPI003B008388